MNSSKEKEKLIIVGAGETAEIAYEYFTHDSEYEVIAFSVESDYINANELFGLPIVAFETLEEKYDPQHHKVFVAVSYTKLNRVRTSLYQKAKQKGFSMATYISSKAFVWHNVEIGENCFIFENNVIQYKAKIGNNVILWSGNHIGHRAVIHDNCFISSHVVVSGYCEIEENSFLGVNSCLADHVKIGLDNVIGAGAVITKNTEAAKVYIGNPAQASKASSLKLFKVSF
ncbi:acetyltransferase [Pseudanabaena sp. FACHB-1998]|uniref:acetyltransferase n=1 Tax=Pseudanabaena sp. FACHB-1998 TaxID=2692858 RepID=UPI0016811F89|nr:acetyltransferase [Pseudanabaena sp. FACHB-1998]MBD2177254.1 acetyltransferase [Pseudanabaena sp. FACHB-1998]